VRLAPQHDGADGDAELVGEVGGGEEVGAHQAASA
jgi:hypothetical protein